MDKKKVLFVYNHEYPDKWKDGLWAALKMLEAEYEIQWHNLAIDSLSFPPVDFILGWGAFGGPVDKFLQNYPTGTKKGLCVAGNTYPPFGWSRYDVIFYETEWSKNWLLEQGVEEGRLIHAFGVNRDIYRNNFSGVKIWDYATVGAFADWKRQRKLINKPGLKIAIGEIQKGNLDESLDIIGDLMLEKVMISDMVEPENLARIYCATRTVYIPADLFGGGERAILEARSCGCRVEVEKDNPKLQELLSSPIWEEKYYAHQLKEGIMRCLGK